MSAAELPESELPATELLENQPSRYVVGIDLGTTNSAVCFVDAHERPWQVRVLPIPQAVAPGVVESLDSLPSFHYQPPESSEYVVGGLARDYGSAMPGRLIASAKSWLCHTGVDRTAELLPWHAASDVERISPVEASARYLSHIKDAWNKRFKHDPLERQDLVLTLPASFDEIARELTVQAAARAGLPRVVLIEEPQAAFYAWIYKHRENWETLVAPGQTILVCDIGGGTTDFTLIRVRRSESGQVQFHRVAVGDHLILGGDNMDLALARHLESKFVGSSGVKLEPRQWDVLVRLSRQVKEQLLLPDVSGQLTVTIPGTGSKLIGGSLKTQITPEEVRELLVEGFMPRVELSDKPAARRSGFQEFGLPFAADAAITRHLAAFLSTHAGQESGERESGVGDRGSEGSGRPDVVLFNGGVFASEILRQRLVESIANWYSDPRLHVLDNDRLDLAVARGAAYYGMVRRGEGVKIVASLARTYYIGVESPTPDSRPPVPAALCLVPGSAEPGQDIILPDRQFDLLVSEPVEFPLFTSSVRLTDQPGQLVPLDPEQMTALPPIRTALKTRSRRERGTVAVHLHARLTEIGTLDLWCSEAAGDRTWRLQFDVRSATQTELEAHETDAETQGFADEATVAACQRAVESVFGDSDGEDPDALNRLLGEAAGSQRHEWPTSLLRRVWELLIERESGRRRSARHEARWLNLLGYALRPGFGFAVDDWRVAETWKTVQGKLAHRAPTSRTESLILWRRIAGGLSPGQQRALAEPLVATVRALFKRQTSGAGKAADPTFSPHETLEVLRLLASLELLAAEIKIELGRMLVELLPKKKLESIRPAVAWSIGRLGAREPAYGPLNTIVPPDEAAKWCAVVLEQVETDPMSQFALVNLARRTGDRYRDLPDRIRDHIAAWLEAQDAGEHAIVLVREGGTLAAEEQSRVFGESLPKGLRLR
jgi:hypothetical protein